MSEVAREPSHRVTFQPRDVDGNQVPFLVQMEVAQVDGRLRCVDLQVSHVAGGPAVTTEALRSLPIGQLTIEAGKLTGLNEGWTLPPNDFAERFRSSRRRVDDDLLVAVAQVYRWASATGRYPFGVFADRFGIQRGTAARWVSLARRRGHLGEAVGAGRVGEAVQPAPPRSGHRPPP
jgi:hypothetical protein